jgi:hypothetical protein
MMFRIGQRVICVRDEPPAGGVRVLLRGAVYTVSRVYPALDAKGEYGVELGEITTPSLPLHLRAFEASRFIPLADARAPAS